MPTSNNSHPDKDRELTLEQFDNMSWDEVWKRAIPIEDKEAFIRENKKRKS